MIIHIKRKVINDKKETNKNGTMKKNILVTFNMTIGEYEHSDKYIFCNKTTDYNYCKQFWGLKKKNKLEEGVYWDNQMLNVIRVYSTQEITEQETKTLKRLGVA